MFISRATYQRVVGHVQNEWCTVTRTDTKKMVWKAQTYSKLCEYTPHFYNHHQNGGREVHLVQSVSPSGHGMHSTEQTCNQGTGWWLVHHMNGLLCLASLQVAPSATNQICQTPPWDPATNSLYYGLNDLHWCCIHCRCHLQYITGFVVPATSNDHNAFRYQEQLTPSQSLISQKTQILWHTTVCTSNSTNIFFLIYMTVSFIGQWCGWVCVCVCVYIYMCVCVTQWHGYILKNMSLGNFAIVRTSQSVLTKT
jgi:hypothetical protein